MVRIGNNLLQDLTSILGDDEQSPANRRLITYLTGCSTRNVERLMNNSVDESLVSGSISPENCFTVKNNTTSNEKINMLRTYNILHWIADRCWLTVSGVVGSKPEYPI